MPVTYGRGNSMIITSKDGFSDDVMSVYFNHPIWKQKRGDGIPDAPLDVQLELVNRCNLSCLSCPIKSAKRGVSRLTWDVLEKIVTDAAEQGVAYFTICGIGEAALHPDLFKLLKLLRNKKVEPKGLRVFDFMPSLLVSNCVWSESQVDSCIESPPDVLSVSLAGLSDEDIFLRRGINADIIYRKVERIYNSRRLRREVDGKLLPVIHVSTHLYPKEFVSEDLERFKAKWFRAADVVVVKPTMLDLHFKDYENFLNSSNYVKLSSSNYERTLPCFETARRLSIASDGEVWCGHHNAEDFGAKLGNIYTQSIREIWHGDAMTEFRREVLAGTFKRPNCRACGGEIREEKRC